MQHEDNPVNGATQQITTTTVANNKEKLDSNSGDSMEEKFMMISTSGDDAQPSQDFQQIETVGQSD